MQLDERFTAIRTPCHHMLGWLIDDETADVLGRRVAWYELYDLKAVGLRRMPMK